MPVIERYLYQPGCAGIDGKPQYLAEVRLEYERKDAKCGTFLRIFQACPWSPAIE
jgi:hypothetical protein